MTFKPMLACAPGPEGVTSFPVLATPKIDGIRALMLGGALLSRTLKPIPNLLLRAALESALPDGCDGEITHGGTFQNCTSAVMSGEGPTSGFTYYAFDYVGQDSSLVDVPYSARIAKLHELMSSPSQRQLTKTVAGIVRIGVLHPVTIVDLVTLDAFEKRMLAEGYEGVIVRRPDGRYKLGRATPKEALMLKIKRFEDAEATVTGVDELVHRGLPDTKSKLLGALVAVRPDGVAFKIGTGFSADQRRAFWSSRVSLVGRAVKYKFFRIGTAEAPRFPTFIGFRDFRDM